jgi:hypothetical protein
MFDISRNALPRISHHDTHNQSLTAALYGFQQFSEKTVCFFSSISPKDLLVSFYRILGWTCEKFGLTLRLECKEDAGDMQAITDQEKFRRFAQEREDKTQG